MEFRKLPKGNEEISTLGIGGEWLFKASRKEVGEIFDCAMDNGVNLLDIWMPEPEVRDMIGDCLVGRREKMHIQGHICSTYQNGQYTRTRDLEQSRIAFEDLLARLKTDYIDFGMVHYVDSEEDFQNVFASGIFDYVKSLKEQGVVRRLGFSSHNPVIAKKLKDTGVMDLCMFSVNPAYDMDAVNVELEPMMEFKGVKDRSLRIAPLRAGFYAECARDGVGITVMKGLAGGRLLNGKDSPFGRALSVHQCMHYSLTRPAVLAILVGVRSLAELKDALRYYGLSDAERDYSEIAKAPKYEMTGKCMYCNHCLPCPSNIDIAAVNQFLDLATIDGNVPDTVRAHYRSLKSNAEDCTECGVCEENCPFGVEIRARMRQAVEVFR
jgi:uncharacterized protein